MRILLAISEMPPRRSGVARVGQRLSEGFVSAGHLVEVLSTEHTKRLSLGEFRLTGLLPRWPWLRNKLDGVDVVSLHGPAPTFSDALLVLLALRKQRGAPRVVYTHHFDIDVRSMSPLSTVYNRMHRRLARLADHVVVTTPTYASTLGHDVSLDRLTVIPWAAECPITSAPPDRNGQFTVLFVGQLRPYKGVNTLIQAASSIPEARIKIVGHGPERTRLERLVEELDLRNVTFLGTVPDRELWDLYHASHAVVLPSVSRQEAFGIVLLEGMSAGCVPVASAVPGVVDIVGEAGATYPPGDSDALADILATLAHDGERWRHYSQTARERSLRYTWDKTIESYLAVFQGAARVGAAGGAVRAARQR